MRKEGFGGRGKTWEGWIDGRGRMAGSMTASMTDGRGQIPATGHPGLPPATRNEWMAESMTDDRWLSRSLRADRGQIARTRT
jgi:hypothetical protein